MIPFFRRRAANREVVDRLNAAVVGVVRDPCFYTSGGVPDTFNGRFELLVLLVGLVVRRLRALPPPGSDLGQALVDEVFRNLDPAMRELGVGDLAVPKRMKRLVEAFLGRSVAYDAALAPAAPAGALEATLGRNVHGGARDATDLASYVREAAGALERQSNEDLLRGVVLFPKPAAFLSRIAPV